MHILVYKLTNETFLNQVHAGYARDFLRSLLCECQYALYVCVCVLTREPINN